jgi:hypothetical protein
VHTGGVRASDKGFLQLSWKDYLELLRWTAKQAVDSAAKLPPKLATLLASLGIDASMWRDLVWNFRKYFGRGVCAGSPEAMAEDAKRNGRHWHRGQKTARLRHRVRIRRDTSTQLAGPGYILLAAGNRNAETLRTQS